MKEEMIVICTKKRQEILFKVAHYKPMSGHLEQVKTLDCLMAQFYWVQAIPCEQAFTQVKLVTHWEGVGGVLSQMVEGEDRPVLYISHKLSVRPRPSTAPLRSSIWLLAVLNL